MRGLGKIVHIMHTHHSTTASRKDKAATEAADIICNREWITVEGYTVCHEYDMGYDNTIIKGAVRVRDRSETN